MRQEDMNNQIKELQYLWHELIKIGQNNELNSSFPNFQELSTTEIGIIQIVSLNPEVILGEICAALDLPKSTLTNTVNRLEKRGYLNRTISKRDMRSYGLSLTEKGKLAQKEHLEYEALVFGGILHALNTEEERASLLLILKKIVHKLQSSNQK